MTSSTSTFEILTTIGTIATPLLLILISGIGWAIQNRMQKAQKVEEELRLRAHRLEEELRDDRLEVYNEILEPFIILFTKDEAFLKDKAFKGKDKSEIAQEKILSLSYKQAAFKLSLFADDNVVRAYNNLMQFFYTSDATSETSNESEPGSKAFGMLSFFGSFLLEIRKSIGNNNSELTNFEMLEWMITDMYRIEQLKNEQ